MRSERVEFTGSGGNRLAGRLELPSGTPRAFALFAHCFTCGKDAVAASRFSRALTDFGIAVLRFDFTGLGGSEGDFANTDFSSNVADLVAAADHLGERHRPPSILVGHSLGGAAVLAAAEHVREARAVVTIGAPADTEHLTRLLSRSRAELEERGEAEVSLAGRTFRIRRELLDDLHSQPQHSRIANLDAALLVLHSPVDESVGIENARQIFDTARHPKSFVALDGADHLLSGRDDARFAASVTAAWASRYLDAPAEEESPEGPVADEVTVTENGTRPYGQQVLVGSHELTADEPEPLGEDSGPSPYDLVLAGLGACTNMTVRMYAERKKWPLEQVSVTMRHSRIHADDCAECETETGKLDHVERWVELSGDLSDEQRSRLLDIADRCPVHRTLHSEVVVETKLRGDD